MTLPVHPGTVGALLEYLEFEYRIRGRKELAAELNITEATIGKLYRSEQPLSAKLILHIHEYFGVEVWKIRELSGQSTEVSKRKLACRPAQNY